MTGQSPGRQQLREGGNFDFEFEILNKYLEINI